jgi:hypothetical protein
MSERKRHWRVGPEKRRAAPEAVIPADTDAEAVAKYRKKFPHVGSDVKLKVTPVEENRGQD